MDEYFNGPVRESILCNDSPRCVGYTVLLGLVGYTVLLGLVGYTVLLGLVGYTVLLGSEFVHLLLVMTVRGVC